MRHHHRSPSRPPHVQRQSPTPPPQSDLPAVARYRSNQDQHAKPHTAELGERRIPWTQVYVGHEDVDFAVLGLVVRTFEHHAVRVRDDRIKACFTLHDRDPILDGPEYDRLPADAGDAAPVPGRVGQDL